MKSSLANPEPALYQCPACGCQVNPEAWKPTDDLTHTPCGQALWFVLGVTNGDRARTMLLTEFIDDGDTKRQVHAILAATGRPSRLVLDLSRLRFLPNSVLRLLLALRGRLNSSGGELVISGLHLRNYNTLKRAHLTNVFCISDDQQEASDT